MARLKHGSRTADTWLLEIISMSLSLTSLIAILILLRCFDRRPLFHWHDVTLNAVISTFGTISRILLLVTVSSGLGQWRWNWYNNRSAPLGHFEMLDRASRGAWGSAKLLWVTKSCVLVAVGAWVTIMALAFDPFVQQILSYHSELVFSATEGASIALAQRWSGGTDTITEIEFSKGPDGNTHVPVTPQLDYSMQAGVSIGLSADLHTIAQQTPFTCSSANCYFDEFLSLAVCSSCVDVTDQLRTTRNPEDGAAMEQNWPINGAVTVVATTSRTLPNGVAISNADPFVDPDGWPPILMTARGTNRPSETLEFKNISTLIIGVTVVRADYDTSKRWQNWTDVHVTATDCALYFCIRNYKAQVVNATVTETSEEIASIRSLDSWQVQNNIYLQKITAALPKVDGLFEPDIWLSRSDLTIEVPSLQKQDGNITSANISQAAIDGLTTYLNQSFLQFGQLGMVGAYSTNATAAHYTTPIMRLFWDSTDLGSRFMKIATSMSSSIRANSDGHKTAPGLVGSYQTFIQVRWAWIALPCACVGFGAAFLVLAIRNTSETGLPLWKNSAIALFFHGLDYEALRTQKDEVLASDMQEASERLTVTIGDELKLERAEWSNSRDTQPETGAGEMC